MVERSMVEKNMARSATYMVPTLATLLLAACAGGYGQGPEESVLSGSLQAQFKCADRNHNDYIDKAELVYLHQCGVGEDLRCGAVREVDEEVTNREEFRLGRRMLEVMDADGDGRISRLEFRAHCNSNR